MKKQDLIILGMVLIFAASMITLVEYENYGPRKSENIDTILIDKVIISKDNQPSYWLFVKWNSTGSIFFNNYEVDPVFYYDTQIGMRITVNLQTTPIFHITNYHVWSYGWGQR